MEGDGLLGVVDDDQFMEYTTSVSALASLVLVREQGAGVERAVF